MNKIRLFLTLTGYQITWLACVFGEKIFNSSLIGIYVGVIYLILYIYFCKNRVKFFKISFLISIPGYFFDSLMVFYSIYEFKTFYTFGTLPLWMIILWLSFSTLFDEVLIFFKKFKYLGIILSSILGPFTYYLGVSINVLSINNFILFYSLMTIFWFFLMIYYLEIVLKNYSES